MSEIKNPVLNQFKQIPIGLVAISLLIAISVSFSFIIIPSDYSPLYILAGIAGIAILLTWLKKPHWALYFAIFVILLPASIIPDQINSYMNRSLTVIALLVWMIDVIRRRRHINITASTLLLGLFIIWAAISLLWADNITFGVNSLQKYILRLVVFLILVVNEINTRKNLNGLMNTLVLSGFLLVVVSIITIFSQGYESGTRLQVLGENANGLGISLLITLPAVILWAARSSNHRLKLKKIVAIIFLLATIGIIGLSGSRGSAISLGITLLAFLIWKTTRFWGILGLLIIVAAVIIAPIIFTSTITRFLETLEESSLGGREYIWPVGWLLIKDHLALGVGIGNSPYQVIPYLADAGIIRRGLLLVNDISLHNPLLVIWAETGLPGLLLYLGVLAGAIISFTRQFINSRKIHDEYLMTYFAVMISLFLGYMASWIKGGGLESSFSYFLVIALLLIPSQIKIENSQNS